MRNKIHDLRNLIRDIVPQVITISETKIDASFPNAQFHIDGYLYPDNFRRDRNQHGGGLITYIKKGIPHKRLVKIEPKHLEVTCIELTFGKRKWGYVAIYRPPNSSIKAFFIDITKCLEQLTNYYDHLIITGDININTKDKTSPGYQIYENFLDTFGLTNLIKHDTCFTKRNDKHTSTSLDVFLTNVPKSFFNSHTIATGISDCHLLIGSFMKATYKRAEPQDIEYRNYKKLYGDIHSFLREIDAIDSNISTEDKTNANIYYDKFTSTFQDILQQYAPLKKTKVRGNDGGFANKELRKAWYKRSKLLNMYNRNKTDENWDNYKKQRNKCTSLIRKAKSKFFIDKTKDRESFWKIFGPFISSKGHHTQEDYIVSVDGELVNDKKKVANEFNNYFINIIENSTGKSLNTYTIDPDKDIIDQIINSYKNHPSILLIKEKMKENPELTTFQMPKSTQTDMYRIITKIKTKSSQGYDKIPAKILKITANEISKPLSNIVNVSIDSGVFVDTAKISLCTPLYKNPPAGSRQQIPLYRPLNVCTSFSKILERYNLNSMLEHVNTILSKNITAYRKGHSCQNVLLKLTEEWRKYIDQNKIVGGLLMDLSKAFDCLPHELLVAKLEAYGFENKTLHIFYSYLKNRKQAVKINGILSDFLEILSGVPQGSILGPIIFNIFINDLIYHMEHTSANIANFADDNTFSAFADTVTELKQILDEAAKEALVWLDNNNMIANPDKFKAMVLKKPSIKIEDIGIIIGDMEVRPVSSIDLLGLKIYENLNFRKHIKSLCAKAGAKLNAIKRLRSYINESDRKLLVDAHVISQFNYSSTVWHFCGLTEIHKMEKLHEKCIIFIYNEYDMSYFELLKKNQLTTLFGKRILAMCCETFKTIHGLNAGYMQDIFEKRPSKYPSRYKNNLYVPKVNQVTYGYKSFRVQGPKTWNLLPNDIKQIESFDTFKQQLKTITMPFCSCESCLTLQVQCAYSSTLVENMLQDILINK